MYNILICFVYIVVALFERSTNFVAQTARELKSSCRRFRSGNQKDQYLIRKVLLLLWQNKRRWYINLHLSIYQISPPIHLQTDFHLRLSKTLLPFNITAHKSSYAFRNLSYFEITRDREWKCSKRQKYRVSVSVTGYFPNYFLQMSTLLCTLLVTWHYFPLCLNIFCRPLWSLPASQTILFY